MQRTDDVIRLITLETQMMHTEQAGNFLALLELEFQVLVGKIAIGLVLRIDIIAIAGVQAFVERKGYISRLLL